MRFRPCIDIHNGKVKQIVGGSLQDDNVRENFVAEQDAKFYAQLYRKSGISGGHIILLNPVTSPYYEKSRQQAIEALHAYPQGLQIGGSITDENAKEYLREGASHVIVTSYVFHDGQISYRNLEQIKNTVGKEHLVLDLSCRKKGNQYYIVTNRWQTFTNVAITPEILTELAAYCDEFLIHAVDAEGKSSGIEIELVKLLAQETTIPITYAGGVGSFEDLCLLKRYGRDHLDVTVGSALDLFGGPMKYTEVLKFS